MASDGKERSASREFGTLCGSTSYGYSYDMEKIEDMIRGIVQEELKKQEEESEISKEEE